MFTSCVALPRLLRRHALWIYNQFNQSAILLQLTFNSARKLLLHVVDTNRLSAVNVKGATFTNKIVLASLTLKLELWCIAAQASDSECHGLQSYHQFLLEHGSRKSSSTGTWNILQREIFCRSKCVHAKPNYQDVAITRESLYVPDEINFKATTLSIKVEKLAKKKKRVLMPKKRRTSVSPIFMDMSTPRREII